jgi:hypothetical protein
MSNRIAKRKRQSFADFLDRLSTGTQDRDDWREYAVNHYHDEMLEQIRRDCVRLAIEPGESFPRTDAHRAQLRTWATELRTSVAE